MRLKNYWRLRKSKARAFTLLESLVALLVISGSLLLFQAMSQLLVSEVRYQQKSEQKEWLIFVDQLEAELNRAQFEKVENDRLYRKPSAGSHVHWHLFFENHLTLIFPWKWGSHPV